MVAATSSAVARPSWKYRTNSEVLASPCAQFSTDPSAPGFVSMRAKLAGAALGDHANASNCPVAGSNRISFDTLTSLHAMSVPPPDSVPAK
jgi:hypothetical protein